MHQLLAVKPAVDGGFGDASYLAWVELLKKEIGRRDDDTRDLVEPLLSAAPQIDAFVTDAAYVAWLNAFETFVRKYDRPNASERKDDREWALQRLLDGRPLAAFRAATYEAWFEVISRYVNNRVDFRRGYDAQLVDYIAQGKPRLYGSNISRLWAETRPVGNGTAWMLG